MNIDTKTVNVEKLMAELNARPELWLVVLQSMGEMAGDELADDPEGHANFQTLLAVAFAEHTSTFDENGEEATSVLGRRLQLTPPR